MVIGGAVQMPSSTPMALSREVRRHRETGMFNDVKVAVAYYSQHGQSLGSRPLWLREPNGFKISK